MKANEDIKRNAGRGGKGSREITRSERKKGALKKERQLSRRSDAH